MATSETPPLTPSLSKPVQTAPNTHIELPTGKPFRETEVSAILRANVTPIVLLAGSAKCGKTTLLASLHDNFQRGSSFAGYLSAGSKTLFGFEERCFDSRLASGGENPTTQRTRPADGLLFYHLKLRDEDLKSPIRHLLVGDMSGELYAGAMDSGTEMRKQTIITRADHFVQLIDAGRLASSEFRGLTRTNALLLFRRCLEEQMFESDAKVDVLLTKWDVAIARCGTEEKAIGVLKETEDEITKLLTSRVGRLRIAPVASRPHFKSRLSPAYGLGAFLRSWVEEPPRKSAPRITKFPEVDSDRIFDRFAFGEFPEMFESGRNV